LLYGGFCHPFFSFWNIFCHIFYGMDTNEQEYFGVGTSEYRLHCLTKYVRVSSKAFWQALFCESSLHIETNRRAEKNVRDKACPTSLKFLLLCLLLHNYNHTATAYGERNIWTIIAFNVLPEVIDSTHLPQVLGYLRYILSDSIVLLVPYNFLFPSTIFSQGIVFLFYR